MLHRAPSPLRSAAIVGLLGVLVSLGGCQSACACAPTPTPLTTPRGALSEDAAIAAAKRQAPPSTSELSEVWANVTVDPFAVDPSQAQLVWTVGLQGEFVLPSCPPGFMERTPARSDPPCLYEDAGLMAVLDIFSGTLLGWTH